MLFESQGVIPFWNCIYFYLPKVLIGAIVTGVILSDTECEVGYVEVDNLCVDMCEGINCGNGGSCLSGNCTCQKGYAKVENFCEETCALTSCEELIKIRQNIGIFISLRS